jgi:hypothetical protein
MFRHLSTALWLMVVAIVFGFSHDAMAQGESLLKRIEVSGSVGQSGLRDGEGTLGTGTNTAVGAAFYVL